MNRRKMLAVTGVAGSSFAAQGGGRSSASEGASKTYVLIHGAWHGGWCWRDVRRGLQGAGHRVFTPSLTGLGDRVHLRNPKINLSTHVTDVINLLDFEELDDVILVGHSYAGHVVSCVADKVKERLRHIVFLDAVLAVDGKPFLPAGVGEARIKTAKDGYLMAVASLEFLGIPEGHPNADWVRRRLVEHPLPTLMETVVYENGGPSGIAKTFVRCTQNPRMADGDPVAELTKNDPEWRYLLIDTGHDLMVTAPDETARILMDIA